MPTGPLCFRRVRTYAVGVAEELEAVVEGTLEVEIPDEQKRSRVWRHPERDTIVALIRAGKSPDWISKWLESKYPTQDENEVELPEAARNRRMRIAAETIGRYRAKWMPECAPGVDLISTELQDLVGRHLPTRERGPEYELEVFEMGVRVAEVNLAKAMKTDADLGMLQGITLEAQRQYLDAAGKSMEAKQNVGVPGYEEPVERFDINTTNTNKNLSVELHGVVDPRTGKVRPSQPGKVDAVLQLLEAGPEAAAKIMEAAKVAAADEPEPADVVEVPAEEPE